MILNKWDWTKAYELEARFRHIFSEQATRGWKIDIPLMEQLKGRLEYLLDKHYNEVRDLAPKRVSNERTILKPIKKDGDYNNHTKNWWNGLKEDRVFPITNIVGSFTRIKVEKINPGSSPQKIEALKRTGWTPTDWNYKKDKRGKIIYKNHEPIKTTPTLTKESVLRSPLGQLMMKYKQVQHRSSMINGFFERLREDGSLETGGNTVGAVTGRTRHFGVVNVPKVGNYYGEQIRSLFTHREDYILLGADLSALENRLMGHYTYPIDNGVYAKRLMEECPHDKTMELFSELNIDRDTSKTCNYALGFGCGIKKLATILDCTESKAAIMKNIWWRDKQPLVDLQKQLESCSQGRDPLFIKGLDGRKVFGRNKKDLVNTLIQSAGAIVNKFITVEIHNELNSRGIKDIHQISNFHDEVNFELKEEQTNVLKEIINNSVNKCNKYFKFYVPMAMDIKLGKDWSQIH